MKKIIMILLLLMIPIATANEQSSTDYQFNFFWGNSGGDGIAGDIDIGSGIGQDVIDVQNDTGLTLHNGVYPLADDTGTVKTIVTTTTTTTTTTTQPKSGVIHKFYYENATTNVSTLLVSINRLGEVILRNGAKIVDNLTCIFAISPDGNNKTALACNT